MWVVLFVPCVFVISSGLLLDVFLGVAFADSVVVVDW